jgi:6-phosphogluconolactonase
MKKNNLFMTFVAVATLSLFSCKKETNLSQGQDLSSQKANPEKENTSVGYVYTLSNQVGGNNVIAYSRSAAGTLTYSKTYSTGGNGTGSGLGSQGSLTLSRDKDILLAVNAGSNSLSSFTLSGGELHLQSTIASGGTLPISVTVYDHLVYVLNAGGTGNISGFSLDDQGRLNPLANSTRPLSTSASGPAEISFAQNGAVLVITEKATNRIITYTINSDGTPAIMHSLPSANPTPFGFAVGENGSLYVSEAAGGAAGASSVSFYHVDTDGIISLVNGPVSAAQTAACWVALTNNGKYVYATNAGSNTVSSFFASSSTLNVSGAAAASTNIRGPIDAALSNNSKFLYVLNSGGRSITAFQVNNDGSLTYTQNVTGMLSGDVGLAAK